MGDGRKIKEGWGRLVNCRRIGLKRNMARLSLLLPCISHYVRMLTVK